MDPEIEKLIALQEKDSLCQQTELRIKALPDKIKRYADEIEREQQALEDSRSGLRERELKRSEMRTERRSMEDQIARYKNQQLQVKKNDEYQALSHEIETLEKKIDEAEGVEIELLMEIDEVRESLKATESDFTDRIQKIETDKAETESRLKKLEEEIVGIREEVAKAEEPVTRPYMLAYQNARKRFKKPPFVVPIIDHKAQGLKVSNEVETAAKKAESVVVCDNTGKIVYIP